MTGKALFVGLIVFVVAAAALGSLSYHAAVDNAPQIAIINGQQRFFATIKYPTASNLPKLPVKVTLSLDNDPPVVVVTTPEAKDPQKFDIIWDTKKNSNGEHMVYVKAFWGTQMVGEESRRVDIAN